LTTQLYYGKVQRSLNYWLKLAKEVVVLFSVSSSSRNSYLVLLEKGESERVVRLAVIYAAWALAQPMPNSSRQLRLEEAIKCLTHEGVDAGIVAGRMVDLKLTVREIGHGGRFAFDFTRSEFRPALIMGQVSRYATDISEQLAVHSAAENADVTALLRRAMRPTPSRRDKLGTLVPADTIVLDRK
jgi:hypothetical protein